MNKIVDDILGMLQSDRQPQQPGLDAGGGQLIGGLMGEDHRRGVRDQKFSVPPRLAAETQRRTFRSTA